MKEKIEQALNNQVNEEIFSAYLYYAMEAYFNDINLLGYANWMHIQALEELSHAQKIISFINDRGGRVKLAAIKEPKATWESPLNAFEEAYKHEQHITGCIDDLVGLARDEGDRATEQMLQWFVEEQVEEEANADEKVQELKLSGGEGAALFMLDREAKARVFTPPVKGE